MPQLDAATPQVKSTRALAVGARSESHVWLLTNAPSPYQAELFTAISARDDVRLSVRLMRDTSSSGRAETSHFDSRTLAALAPATWRDELRLHPRAVWESACGRVGVGGLLVAARQHGLHARTLDVRSSGDTAGPRDQVVGYGAYEFA